MAVPRQCRRAQDQAVDAIIGISSIHLLKTFINAANIAEHTIMWQVIIHVVFLVSALAMAMVDKIMTRPFCCQNTKERVHP
jgi:uncharacterized protein (TIGR00645 family)